MNLRQATLADSFAVWQLHSRSIKELCRDDYTQEQLEAWAGHRTPEDFRVRIQNDPFYVAEVDGRIVGYARFQIDTSELCSVYVDPDFSRRGIGKAMVRRVFGDARSFGLTQFWLEASLTAVPFYESLGFTQQEETMRQFSGVSLRCVRMARPLPLPSDRDQSTESN